MNGGIVRLVEDDIFSENRDWKSGIRCSWSIWILKIAT